MAKMGTIRSPGRPPGKGRCIRWPGRGSSGGAVPARDGIAGDREAGRLGVSPSASGLCRTPQTKVVVNITFPASVLRVRTFPFNYRRSRVTSAPTARSALRQPRRQSTIRPTSSSRARNTNRGSIPAPATSRRPSRTDEQTHGARVTTYSFPNDNDTKNMCKRNRFRTPGKSHFVHTRRRARGCPEHVR